jgi:peptidase E
VNMTKCILVGGYPSRATDGGRSFSEELVKGFSAPVKILDCLFARPVESWDQAFQQDKEFFQRNLPSTTLEIQLATPETFLTQMRWANAIYLRGGDTRTLIQKLNSVSGWTKELGGKTLAGSSAGADAISTHYYNLDMLTLEDGLGILPVKVIPHWQSDYNAPHIDWEKSKKTLEAYKENLPVLTLSEGYFEVWEV